MATLDAGPKHPPLLVLWGADTTFRFDLSEAEVFAIVIRSVDTLVQCTRWLLRAR